MIPERIVRRILVTEDGCWEWLGYVATNGYGHVSWEGKVVRVHRLMWTLTGRDLPEHEGGRRLELDHLCRNRACCNPDHLELVSHRENLMRGDTLPAAQAAKTHCPQGHPYAGANLYINPKGKRECRECKRDRMRFYRQRQRDATTNTS